LCITIYVAE